MPDQPDMIPFQETEASLRSKGFRRKDSQSITATRSTVPVQVDNSPDSMIRIALSQGASMDEIGQLIKFRNDEISRLAKLSYLQAMKEFQAVCPNLVKSKEVKFDHRDGQGKTNYKYLDLAGIQDVIRTPLSSMGLSVSWTTTEEKGVITVTCTCSHQDGHSESTTLSGEADMSGKKNNIQSKASTITYLRRYTLTGVLGISTGDIDNDGVDSAVMRKDTITKLVKPDDAMYMSLLKSVRAGTITVDQLEKAYQFTDEQLETLKTVDS